MTNKDAIIILSMLFYISILFEMIKTRLRIHKTTWDVATSISLLDRKNWRQATQEEMDYYNKPIDEELIDFGNEFLWVDYHTGNKVN